MSNPYQDAIFAQSACNLSGLTHSLSRHLTEHIWPEVRANGGGTDDVNRHPVVIMFLNQMLYLATGKCIDYDAFYKANEICEQRSQEVTA